MAYKESTWEGFKRLDFDFEGHAAILIVPREAEPKRRWMLH